MKKTLYFIICSFLIIVPCLSQKIIEIGIIGSPRLSKINFENTNSFSTRYRFSLSFGGQVNYIINKFRISTGVSYLKQGGDLKVLETSIINPSGTGNYFYIPLITMSMVIPTTINYEIYSKNKTKFWIGTGLTAGYLFSQYQDNSGFMTTPIKTINVDGSTYVFSGTGTPKQIPLPQ